MGLAVALVGAGLVDESAAFLTVGTFESWRHSFELSYAQAATVFALEAPGALLGNALVAMADRRSRRVIASGGAIAYALALGAFAWGPHVWVLGAAAFVIGLGSTAMVHVAHVALADASGPDVATNVARANVLAGVGDLLGPLAVIAAAAAGLSWRVPVVAGAVFVGLYGVWLATLRVPAAPAPETESPPDGLRAVLADRRVWILGAVALLMVPLDEPFLAFLVARLEQTQAMSTAAATVAALFVVLGSIAGAVRESRAPAGRGPRTLRLPALAAAVAVLGTLLPWGPARFAAAFLFGAAIAVTWVRLEAIALTLRPGRAGTVMAAVTTVELAGVALAPLAGTVSDTFGLAAGAVCFAGFAALMATLPHPGRATSRAARKRRVRRAAPGRCA